MDIQEIDLARLLIDETMSPRDRVNSKHVDEFVEMSGEWPPVLVRPIQDDWYTHQLIDGFHRTQAAEKLCHDRIRARVEAMDDETAIARALRENLHGLPIPVEYRKEVCVRLRKLGWKQERIAKETGITDGQVGKYLAAGRVDTELSSREFSEPEQTQLTIEQKAAIGRILPKNDKLMLVDDPKREAARAQVPTLAKAAADHKLPPPIVSALADATLAAPEEAPRIIERAITEKLAPDAIRTVGRVLADPQSPTELKARILESDTLIQDAKGNIPVSEIPRLRKLHEQASPAAAAMPFSGALVKLAEVVMVRDGNVRAWLECTPLPQRSAAERTLADIAEWAARVQALFEEDRRGSFQSVPRHEVS